MKFALELALSFKFSANLQILCHLKMDFAVKKIEKFSYI